jgi:hypothetical protein
LRFAYDPVPEHLAARFAAQVQPSAGAGPLKARILSAPGSAIARVLAEIENLLGRPLQLPQSELSRVSVFCRFNFLIVDFISVLAGFISLFGHLGNFPLDASRYQ